MRPKLPKKGAVPLAVRSPDGRYRAHFNLPLYTIFLRPLYHKILCPPLKIDLIYIRVLLNQNRSLHNSFDAKIV